MTRLPLLIDAHFHARDLNQTYKGTFETETAAALASGFGTVLAMPSTDPPLLSRSALIRAQEKAAGRIYCDVGFHFGTNGRNTLEFRKVADLVSGLKVYLDLTTGNLQLKDRRGIEWVFKAWVFDKPILVHAEGPDLLETAIGFAVQYKRRLHVCHVSLEEEVRLIQKAKRDGVKVTAEVCPHHCLFTENDLPRLGPYGIMKPPLGRLSDLEAIWRGIKGHVIDIIATDHAPHSQEEKAGDNPPFGVIGEPAFSVMWMICSQRRVSIEDLAFLMYFNPARIFGIRTDAESYMEVDLTEEFKFTREMVHSKAGRSPYEGMKVKGRINRAFLHGVEVIRGGKILANKKCGLVI